MKLIDAKYHWYPGKKKTIIRKRTHDNFEEHTYTVKIMLYNQVTTRKGKRHRTGTGVEFSVERRGRGEQCPVQRQIKD